MSEMRIEAALQKLDTVIDFVNSQLEEMDCPMKAQMQLDIAVEEIFVNIASYAYGDEGGEALIRVERTEDGRGVRIFFADRGIPYDPVAKEDPDVTLSVEERQIGGLGIFMVKKNVDEMIYKYEEGENRLTLVKRF